MLQPSEGLQTVFEQAISIAEEQTHEYVTLEHITLAIFTDAKFLEFLVDFEGELELVRASVDHYIKNNMNDIKVEKKVKPQKTQTVERCFNRAFTQALFNGRQIIEVSDLLLSMLSENKTHAVYILNKAGFTRDKFGEYIDTESVNVNEETFNSNQFDKLLSQFTTNLNQEAQKNKT